jgi:Amt family ammonium transporter
MPSALDATLIGGVGGILVVFSISTLDKVFKIDDPVGAISV